MRVTTLCLVCSISLPPSIRWTMMFWPSACRRRTGSTQLRLICFAHTSAIADRQSSSTGSFLPSALSAVHWRKLVKNIGWANQNIGGQKVVKSDKCIGVSQLLEGTCPGCPSKFYAYAAVASLRAPYLGRCCSCSTPPTWMSLLPVLACHPTSIHVGPPSTAAQQRHRMDLGI